MSASNSCIPCACTNAWTIFPTTCHAATPGDWRVGPPSAGALIQEPARSVETACFLRYCLLLATDRLLMMVRRQVADLWRRAAAGVLATHGDWAMLYQELLAALGAILADPAAGDGQIREHLHSLLAAHRARRPARRAELVRLPWQATDQHPVLQALRRLQDLYAHEQRYLPAGTQIFLGRVWQVVLDGTDRERAFCAFEVATLLTLRRALRNGTVWIDHSLAFRSRERLFIPADRWATQRRPYFRRLGLPTDPAVFLEPLVERAEIGMAAVAAAAKDGTLRIDDELHLTPLAAEEEDPEVAKLRTALDRRIGEAQLPELILAVDAEVRFSWVMLGREPRSTHELLLVYAGILAHGTALSAAERRRAHFHASPRRGDHVGPRRSGFVRHDEPRDHQACLAGPARPASPDPLDRLVLARPRSLGDFPCPTPHPERSAPSGRGHRGRHPA